MGHTCSHFWQMVWEQNCAGIVMLNRCIEKGMVCSITIVIFYKTANHDFFHEEGLLYRYCLM